MLSSYALALAAVASGPPCPAADVAAGRALIRRAVEHHGSRALRRATVDFRFRQGRYRMTRDGGRFRYERWLSTGGRTTHAVLDNDGTTVAVDGRPVPPEHPMTRSSGSAVNSVVYFASVPLPLLDPAVRPCRRPTVVVRGRTYDVLRVQFVQRGGGEDYQDTFQYWIAADGRLDYMAYRFFVNGGGVRFRVATRHYRVGGIGFIDWDNYKHPDRRVALSRLPDLYTNGVLERVSSIRLESVRVR